MATFYDEFRTSEVFYFPVGINLDKFNHKGSLFNRILRIHFNQSLI
jgi:hypothetical protein